MIYLIVFLALLIASPGLAANVYVDPTCSNNGDGTSSASCAGSPGGVGPFNTWVGMTWTAGNSYLQKRGTTHTGKVLMAGTGGTSATNRLTISAYGTGVNPKINATGEQIGIDLFLAATPQAYVTIEHFEVYGVDTAAGNRYNIRLCGGGGNTCNDIVLDDLQIHDPVDPGTPYEADGIWGHCANCTFNDLTVYNIPSDGIWLSDSGNFRLTNSHIYNVDTANRGGASASGDNVQLEETGGSLYIVNNILDHSNHQAKQALNDSTTTGSGGLVANNTFIMASENNGTDSKNVVLTTPDLIIMSNKFIGGWRCLNYGKSGWIIGNVITGCYNVGFISEFGGGSSVQYFMNNTLDGLNIRSAKAVYGLYALNASTNTIYYYNNSTTNFGTGVAPESTVSMPNSTNIFYSNTSAYGANFTPHASTLLTNPLYINLAINGDFRTSGNSPTRRAGTPGYTCKDVRGRPCWTPTDIGAYQSTSGDPAATRAVRN